VREKFLQVRHTFLQEAGWLVLVSRAPGRHLGANSPLGGVLKRVSSAAKQDSAQMTKEASLFLFLND